MCLAPTAPRRSKLKNLALVESVLIKHSAFEEASQRAKQCIEYVKEGGREPACLALVGESRTGKSRCIEGILSQYPMTRTKSGIVSPVLAIVVPSKPTVKSLAERFLMKLKCQDWQKGTETQKTARLMELMVQCEVVGLVVDEFHHFYDKGSHKVQHHVADWLKNIVSESRVALIASGLKSLTSVIDQNEQLAGRFGYPVTMPRFNWLNKEQRSEWRGILDGFNDVLGQTFDMPKLSNSEMSFRLYCATGGLIGYLTNTLRQAVWNAVDTGANKITLEDLDTAYRRAVWKLEARTIAEDEVTPLSPMWNQKPSNESLVVAALSVGLPAVELPTKSKRAAKVSASSVLAT
jgi:hypothetical protein